MTASEAKKTISEITADIIGKRGDISTSRVRAWAAAYTHWRAACEPLSKDEIDEAIFEGRMGLLDSLADDHESATYEVDGEAAFGRED